MQSIVTIQPTTEPVAEILTASNSPVLIPVHISFAELLATVATLTKPQKWQLYQALGAELAPHSAEAKAIARLEDEDDPSQWVTVIEEGEEIDELELNKWLIDRGYKNLMYKINLHQSISTDDLSLLPEVLKNDFIQYQRVLQLDPYQTRNIPSHDLYGQLKNFRALEIDYNGVSYRLVYRVYESSSPKRVQVLSFAEHDLAYQRAKDRK